MPVERDIAGSILPNLRRIGPHRIGNAGHHRQRCDIGYHQFRRVHGLRRGFRHDDGNRLADMANAPHGQGLTRGRGRDRQRKIRHGQIGNGADAGRLQIAAGENAEHARGSTRSAAVHPVQHAMGVLRPHEGGVGLTRQVDVVGIGAATADEPCILSPARMRQTHSVWSRGMSR
jgi:hypothetical protein